MLNYKVSQHKNLVNFLIQELNLFANLMLNVSIFYVILINEVRGKEGRRGQLNRGSRAAYVISRG